MSPKRFALLAAALPLFLFADTIERPNTLEERDIQAIREWINTKRQVTVKEKGGALSISGEVRTEMQIAHENLQGTPQRGPGQFGPGKPKPPTASFDIEVSLMLDYRTDTTWASAKLKFDNDAGIIGGSTDRIRLERAIFGVQVLTTDSAILEFDLGRRPMTTFIDSKLEGASLFDGILMKYDYGFDQIGDVYIHPGIFLVNEKDTQYAVLAELGFLDIVNTGLYTKYLFIDWHTKHFDNKPGTDTSNKEQILKRTRFRFINSQLLLGYKFIPRSWNVATKVYAAALVNHAAKRLPVSKYHLSNWGGYAGGSIGELRKKGDFAFEFNYQLLGAQAVPDFDVSGLGLGNTSQSGFYTTNINGSGAATTHENAAGNGNYHGYTLIFEYLFTNNLALFQQWIQTFRLDGDIGPRHRFNRYEAEFNYAF